MKNLFFYILYLFLMCVSCKNEVPSNTNRDNTTSEKLQGGVNKQAVENTNTVTKKRSVVTKAQFDNFFPLYLGSHKRYNVFVLATEALATASYGDFSDTYTYSLADGIKNDAIIKNFKLSYTSELIGPIGTEYIKKERDGHKTIAFLQPKINQYTIEFIYKDRFKLVMEGSEPPNILWTYITKEDLQKLDKLNDIQ